MKPEKLSAPVLSASRFGVAFVRRIDPDNLLRARRAGVEQCPP